ncbi:hypothetical protein ABPG72_020894 [Tetrahymena utriculariae]
MEQENRINFSIQSLSDDILMEIFKFLTLKDIAIIQQINKEWKKCTEKPFLWLRIRYDFKEHEIQDKKLYIQWIKEKISNYDVEQLIINDPNCHLTFQDIYYILTKNFNELQDLELSIYNLNESQANIISLLIVKNCPNLRSFTTYGCFIMDQFMEHFQLLNKLDSLSIMCNDNSFTGSYLRTLPPLKKLFLRPYLIEYNNILEAIRKGKNTLEELAIDTEQMDDDQVIKLFNELNKTKIQSLLLNYCEYFQDEVFNYLSQFAHLKRLKFYKANEVTQDGYLTCFQNFCSTQLIHLNLKECNELNDEGLISILSKSSHLECLKLAWQKNITSESIRYLFSNCSNLQTCVLIGIKSLDARGFPAIQELQQYFEVQKYGELKRNNQYQDDYNNDCINNQAYTSIDIQSYFSKPIDRSSIIKYYQKLRLIDCTKSDMVPDQILQILHLFKPYLVARNYYSEQM